MCVLSCPSSSCPSYLLLPQICNILVTILEDGIGMKGEREPAPTKILFRECISNQRNEYTYWSDHSLPSLFSLFNPHVPSREGAVSGRRQQ